MGSHSVNKIALYLALSWEYYNGGLMIVFTYM